MIAEQAPVNTKESSPLWWLRWVPLAVSSMFALYILYVLTKVALMPLLASLGLAYLISPIVKKIEMRGLSRTTSSIAALVLVGLCVVGLLSYVLPDLWVETKKAVTRLSENFTPESAKRHRAMLKRYSPPLESLAGDHIEEFLSGPSTAIAEITTSDPVKSEVVTSGGDWNNETWLLSTLASSLDLLLVPFFVFYILVDFKRWRKSSYLLIPMRFRGPFSRLFDESGRILQAYVRGQLTIGMIMAICYSIGFWLLGVPAWAGIALLAGLLNAIPYLGTVLGMALACAFTLSSGGGLWELGAVLGVFAAVQSFEGYFLTPRILGEYLSLHPMAVFLGLLIGGKLFGILGIILTIPAIAIAKVFLNFFRELYQQSSFYTGYPSIISQPEARVEDRIAQAAENVLANRTQSSPSVVDPTPEIEGP